MDTDTTIAAPADGGEPIPTDEIGLLGYLAALPPGAQIDVADRLAMQLGGTPGAIDRAADMVSSALAEIAHEKEIEHERAAFAGHLNAATAAAALNPCPPNRSGNPR